MPDFDAIVDDFSFLEDWEERYKYLIDLGQQMPPLPAEDKNDATKVRGCASQVWLTFDETKPDILAFAGESDSHIVSGLIALLVALYSGKPKRDAIKIIASEQLARLDLQHHITPQRSNGLTAMIQRIQQKALEP